MGAVVIPATVSGGLVSDLVHLVDLSAAPPTPYWCSFWFPQFQQFPQKSSPYCTYSLIFSSTWLATSLNLVKWMV